MTKSLVFRAIAVCALLSGTQLVQAACDGTEDWCLRDSYGLAGVENSGTEFALYLTPTLDVPLLGSIVGFADISPDILPPNGALCPVSGEYVEVDDTTNPNIVKVRVGLTSSCFCKDGVNPSMRTMFLRVNKNTLNLPPNQNPPMNLDAHAWRCDGTMDALLGGEIAPSITPSTTPATTPDVEVVSP